jgi:hypothetical protein
MNLTHEQQALDRGTTAERWVRRIGEELGERNLRSDATYGALCRTGALIRGALEQSGWVARSHPYEALGRRVENLSFELPAQAAGPPLIVGAHYDSVHGSPGANDNGSGLACLLRLGALLARNPARIAVRLLAFTNEEPPHTRKPSMGSLVYARECAQRREPLLGMISLETLCTSRRWWKRDAPLLAISNLRSRPLLRSLVTPLRTALQRRVIPLSLPGFVRGANSSDHWSFWKCGYRALMLTAGGPLSYRHYHRHTDQLAHVELSDLEDLAGGLAAMLSQLPAGGFTALGDR